MVTKMIPALLACVLMSANTALASASENHLKQVGGGVMTSMFWDVYEAQLHTSTGEYQVGQHPMRLTLTYLRDFKAKDIVKATKEQWQHLGKPEYVQRYSSIIEDAWPDISAGDSLSYETDADGKGAFYFNDKLLVEVTQPDFSDAFTAIWLSADTSEPKLRQQLLGAMP